MFTQSKWMQHFLKGFIPSLCLLCDTCLACTDFTITTQDNSVVVGRSLEFAQILPTRAQLFPKGEKTQSLLSNQKNGMSWTSKYAFVGMVVLPSQAVMDGFNEKGLSIGVLWFPGAQYPNDSSAPANASLSFADVGRWLLANFSTVEEATAALKKVSVITTKVEGFEAIPPIHLSIHDANGKSAVVEFIKGKMEISDNPIGVLTNAPEFNWHVTNLRNFINLSAINAGSINLDGTVLEPTGQGTGLLGIPGDWTPPSRFVRAAIFKQSIAKPKDAKEGINAALHILNTVDIPYGAIRGKDSKDSDFTQWIVVKDLTNKKLYVRTYDNQNIQTIDLLNEKQSESSSSPRFVDLKT